ncbi:MAG: hypothetical protein FWC03_02640 [Treponema sp.]|nr:hypothetical protein [Treponema sp.]
MELELADYMAGVSGETVNIPSFFNNQGLFSGASNGICLGENILTMTPSELSEYVETQININHSSGCSCTPFISVPLDDMAKLIVQATGGPFGIEIENRPNLANNLRIKIPGLGIPNYISGTPTADNKLRFVNSGSFTFLPGSHLNANNELEIFVNITAPCSGQITPDIVFEWDTAIVKGDTSNLTDDINLDINLTTFLGEGTAFNNVEGYIYINGVSNARLTLKLDSEYLTYGTSPIYDSTLTPRNGPDFPANMEQITQEIPLHSLGLGVNPINFTNVINSSSGTLTYAIDIPQFYITRGVVGKIKADLVIVLPLELRVTGASSVPGYVKLDMGLDELFGGSDGTGDLFGRTGPNESDDIFSQLESVDIIIENRNITIFDQDKLAILVKNKGLDHILDFSSVTSPHWEINSDGFSYPFSPTFEILLKKDNQSDSYATFAVENMAGRFDFTIAVKAVADIEIDIL